MLAPGPCFHFCLLLQHLCNKHREKSYSKLSCYLGLNFCFLTDALVLAFLQVKDRDFGHETSPVRTF